MSGKQAWRLLRRPRSPLLDPASPKHDSRHLFGHSHRHSHQQQQSRFLYAPTRALLTKFRDPAAASAPSAERSATSTFSSDAGRRGFVSWYLGMLDARPVLTKSVTAGLIFTAADLSSQTVTVRPSESFDLIRTSRMAGYGILISGPSLHCWFTFLSKILPKRDIINTLKKMLLGQTVYGPIITTIFFSLNAILQGETGLEIVARLKRDLPPTFLNGISYWPVCDFITFRFIPVRLQPLVSNSFSFIWTIYITYMANLQKAAAAKIATT